MVVLIYRIMCTGSGLVILLDILQVKALYVKNLPKDITQDRLRKLFEHHGKILKVVVPPAKVGKENSRYGFVHFAERSSAMKALKNTEKYEIDGRIYILYLTDFINFCIFHGD